MESLGVDVVVHHIGFDERNMIQGLSPLDEIDAVVRAVTRAGPGSRRSLDSSGDRMCGARARRWSLSVRRS